MVKVLTENETDAFISIRLKGLSESPISFASSFEEGVDKTQSYKNFKNRTDEYYTLGNFEDGNLVGIVGFIREKKLKKKHKSLIWGMYVDPNYRNKGIAKRLLSEVIDRAKKLDGLSKIILSVTQPQENVHKFYQSLGFEKYAVEKDAMRVGGKQIDEIFMSIQL